MKKRIKLISAICLIAQSFTSLVLFFVYANRKKELSRIFLGLGILGGAGGAYLLYKDYMETKQEKLAFEDGEWSEDDGELNDLFDEDGADDINFTIAEDKDEEKDETEEEKKDEEKPE